MNRGIHIKSLSQSMCILLIIESRRNPKDKSEESAETGSSDSSEDELGGCISEC